MKKLFLIIIVLCITVSLQAQVSKTVNVTAGGLSLALTTTEKTTVTNLTLTGTIDARDFKTMRDDMPVLAVLDLSAVAISEYTGTEGTMSGLSPYDLNLIPHNAFYNQETNMGKASLTSVTLPSSATAIGFSAFAKCIGLTSVIIPPSVEYILNSAFGSYTGLSSISIPSSVTTVFDGAFAHCTGLTSINIPSSITSIESTVFSFCTGLKSVIIPSSVTSIGVSAFFGCSGLTSLTIPSSVNSIKSWAFKDCTSLSSITVEWNTPLNISSSSSVFDQVNKATCILNIPIGSGSAYQAANQWQDFMNIGGAGNDFSVSSNTAGLAATAGSTTTIDLTSTVDWTASSDQEWLVVSPSSGTGNQILTFTAEANTLPYRKATVTISASGFDSQMITVIQVDSDTPLILTAGSLKSLFTVDELNTITKLTVTGIIDARDFKTIRDDMPLLAELDLSGAVIIAYTGKEGTNGTDIFEYHDNTVPNNAFAGKTSLTSVIIPLSVTAIGGSAFWGCSGMAGSLYISSNILDIGYQAFDYYHGSFSVDESNLNYSSLDGVLFNKAQTVLLQCPTSKTGNFTIPSSVTTIGSLAFQFCTSLTSIVIPSSVTTYGYSVFYACWGLVSISVDSSSPVDLSSSSGVFNALYTNKIDLYVPVGAINVYKSANQWNEFKSIKEFLILNNQPINADKISIYPNPVTDGFFVTGIKETAQLQLFDINGKLLLTKEIDGDEYISISSLPHGVYFVRINYEAGILEKKLIKN